jgi:excisionase family DNA binding protein
MREQQIYFTRAEAAEYLRCSLRTIDVLREQKKLNTLRLGRKRLFLRSDLDGLARGERRAA